jgi:hypothetical protein
MELICGACHGRLLVESPGSTVACPHCGTFLETPARPATEDLGTLFPDGDDDAGHEPNPDEDTVRLSPSDVSNLDVAHKTPVVASNRETSTPVADGEGTVEAASAAPVAEIAAERVVTNRLPLNAAAPVSESVFETAGWKDRQSRAASSRPAKAAVSTGVSPLLFKVVASYASAVTFLCVYLGWVVMTTPSTLDLPDIPLREIDKKVTTLKYLPPSKQIPPAHVLRLGESRRFGSLKVTPLRVTRGPVEFSYYDPESEVTRPPEGPVLKLCLRFENVSKDQEFVPLDRRLVFTKEPDRKEYGIFKANNFVCRVGERSQLAKHVFAFDLSPETEWIINGQNLDRELKPGDVLETFVATTPEQIDNLSGQLVWRVHFRKGYNPTSHRGVTTLIEVLFQSAEIVDERPPAEQAAEPAGKDV